MMYMPPRFIHALVASLSLHLVLLCGVGWVAAPWASSLESGALGHAAPQESVFDVALAPDLKGGGSEKIESNSLIIEPKPVGPNLNSNRSPRKMARKELPPENKVNSESSAATSGDSVSGSSIGVGANDLGGAGIVDGTRARILRAPKPEYPLRARQAGFEGTVTLNVAIAADGQVERVTILESSGRDDCDEAARASLLEKWQFAPAVVKGEPVGSSERVVVRFQLIERS